MQPIDIKQFELLKTRVIKLEKMITTTSKQILENNAILEKILTSINSIQLDYNTNDLKNQIKQQED